MEIINRICEFNNDNLKRDLDLLGIKYSYDENTMFKTIVLEIAESDPQWSKIALLVEQYSLNVTSGIQYSKKELDEADWLIASSSGHFGYPQPEDSYVSVTYDTSNYCERCGIGSSQKDPFRFRSIPKQKRSSFLQLNWVFDEFFVRPNIKEVLEKKSIFVKFHAWQSIMTFGVLTVAHLVLGTILGRIAVATFSLGLAIFAGIMSWIIGILMLVLWIILLIQAGTGKMWKVPWAGNWAERQISK